MTVVPYSSEAFTYLGGALAVGVLVEVRLGGTNIQAPIYRDTVGTVAPNPLRTDSSGMVHFFAEPGNYDLLVNGLTFPVVVAPGMPTFLGGDEAWLPWSVPGVVGLGTGTSKIYNDSGLTKRLLAVRASANNVSGGPLIVDVKKNGISIFAAAGNRPSIAPGAGTAKVIPDVITYEDGSYLTVDVAQVTVATSLVVQVLTK